jgi:hypothetical protein
MARVLDKHHGFAEREILDLCRRFPQRFIRETKDTGGRPSDVVRLNAPAESRFDQQ